MENAEKGKVLRGNVGRKTQRKGRFGEQMSVLDALEQRGQGGAGCRWWLCVRRKCNSRLLDAL